MAKAASFGDNAPPRRSTESLGHNMRSLLAFALIQVVAFLSGCDTMNWQQFRVTGVAENSPDATRISALLSGVAGQCDLVESTRLSKVPNTLAFFSQPQVPHFATALGARFYQGDVIIDVYAGWGPPGNPTFKKAKQMVTSACSQEFASRCREEKPQVPISH